MKIYTRTGDDGTTSLPDGKRTYKTDWRIELYGTMDELNSYLGLLTSVMEDGRDKDFISEIQCLLFRIGNEFAGFSQSTVSASDVAGLENEIDRLQSSLPPYIRSSSLGGLLRQPHAMSAVHCAGVRSVGCYR